MRVLLIAEFGRSGGTRTFFKRLLEIHKSQNIHTLALIAGEGDEEMETYIARCGFRYRNLQASSKFKSLSVVRNYLFFLPMIRTFKPDLVVCSAGSLRFYFYPFFRELPTLYFLHTYPAGMRWWSKFRSSIPRLFTGERHRIATVSAYSAHAISGAWKINRNYVDVIPNCFNPENRENEDPEPSPDVPNRRKIVLTLGHVIEYKNPAVWLDVARNVTAEIDEVEFLWLGDGRLLNEFRNQSGKDPRIHFAGSRRNVATYYKNADVYFQPSLRESHGIGVVDAMANSLPCVVSDTGGLPESVRDSYNGFLCAPNNVECFSERILELLRNPELRHEFGERGRQMARDHYHPKIQENSIFGLYKRLISS